MPHNFVIEGRFWSYLQLMWQHQFWSLSLILWSSFSQLPKHGTSSRNGETSQSTGRTVLLLCWSVMVCPTILMDSRSDLACSGIIYYMWVRAKHKGESHLITIGIALLKYWLFLLPAFFWWVLVPHCLMWDSLLNLQIDSKCCESTLHTKEWFIYRIAPPKSISVTNTVTILQNVYV